jgi:hypothetical protein
MGVDITGALSLAVLAEGKKVRTQMQADDADER